MKTKNRYQKLEEEINKKRKNMIKIIETILIIISPLIILILLSYFHFEFDPNWAIISFFAVCLIALSLHKIRPNIIPIREARHIEIMSLAAEKIKKLNSLSFNTSDEVDTLQELEELEFVMNMPIE